jgi:hypothetical protein
MRLNVLSVAFAILLSLSSSSTAPTRKPVVAPAFTEIPTEDARPMTAGSYSRPWRLSS